jgi:hypothetical protein
MDSSVSPKDEIWFLRVRQVTDDNMAHAHCMLGTKGYKHTHLGWVESSWNVMAHVDAREGKWRGNWRIVYPALLPLMRTPRLPVVDWTDAPRRFKWTRPLRRKTKSGFCACAITFQTQSTIHCFPTATMLHERASMFRYTCIAWLALVYIVMNIV